MTDTTIPYCYAHPGRETALRCKRCERPICPTCAVRTPTGYMCKDCVRERRKVFDTAMWYDYLVGFGITFIMSLLASILIGIAASFMSLYIFFFAAGVAGAVGVFISNITLRAINKRRSKSLFYSCAAGVALGALPVAFGFFFFNPFAGFAILVYAVITTPIVYKRVAGIQI